MDTLAWILIGTVAMIISWLGGFGAGDQEHPVGWSILIIESVVFLFLAALFLGVSFGIVEFKP